MDITKLCSTVINFEFCTAKEAIDRLIEIFGGDYLLEYISKNNKVDTGYYTWYEDGEECSMGCKNHISHPCERCGRIGAQGNSRIVKYFL